MASAAETLVRHAAYGLELVDVLTGTSLVGTNEVAAERVQASPPTPGPPKDPTPFLVNRSRWAFEDLEEDVVFRISAQHYLPEELETGVEIPSVPLPEDPGILVTVPLTPRTGYPFPPSLTRAVGEVRLDASVDPTMPIVVGAQVTITPIHTLSPPDAGTDLVTRTADDGQYVMWFLPDLTQDPPSPVAFTAMAEATVDVGGVPTHVAGQIPEQPLIQQTFNGAETMFLFLAP